MPRCPSCFVPLARIEEKNFKSFSCNHCFGTWISSIALTRLVRDPAAPKSQATLHELAETVTAAHTTTRLRCPQCEKEMLKDKFHPMVPVGIDRCKPCGMVWLDAGELALLRALYHELMTSDDPEIVRRREKIAAVLAQWDGRTTLVDKVVGQTDDASLGIELGFDLLGHFLRRL
jgi:Zn-finger nucleic acid-binding protein